MAVALIVIETETLSSGMSAKSAFHVGNGGDRDAGLSDLAAGHGMVGVETHLRGEVEGDGEPGLPPLEKIAITLIRLLRGGIAGVLAEGPGTVPCTCADRCRA